MLPRESLWPKTAFARATRVEPPRQGEFKVDLVKLEPTTPLGAIQAWVPIESSSKQRNRLERASKSCRSSQPVSRRFPAVGPKVGPPYRRTPARRSKQHALAAMEQHAVWQPASPRPPDPNVGSREATGHLHHHRSEPAMGAAVGPRATTGVRRVGPTAPPAPPSELRLRPEFRAVHRVHSEVDH